MTRTVTRHYLDGLTTEQARALLGEQVVLSYRVGDPGHLIEVIGQVVGLANDRVLVVRDHAYVPTETHVALSQVRAVVMTL